MNVCYFGSYDPEYARNRIIIKGLVKNDIKIHQIRSSGLIFKRYLSLSTQFLKIYQKFDFIIVGFPGHYDVLLAYFLCKLYKKMLIFDVFATLYETYVIDRKVVTKNSFWAKLYFFLDWLNFKLTDIVIVDTNAHNLLYQKIYGLDPDKVKVVYVGSDSDYFYPRKLKEETDVLFYGSYQPLQGVENIILAAKKLPGVHFKLIGKGQTRPKIEKMIDKFRLKNVELVEWLSMSDLAKEISSAKIILGIFGSGDKADSVIPNKIYDALASKKPIITKRNRASREILVHKEDSLLINNEEELTRSIVKLLKNSKLRNKIANNGYKLYLRLFKPKLVVLELIRLV